MYCKNCGSQIDDNAVVCPHCGVATDNYIQSSGYKTKKYNILAIVGFILSFFMPIAGLVCSIIGYKNAAQYNGEGKNFALAGIVISIVETVVVVIILIICIIIVFAALGMAL